jgi:hypothetical protein
VFTVDGELTELNRNKQPIVDRSNVYAQIKGAVLERGWKPGAAFWKYKEYFGGEEPRGLENVAPCSPSNQIRRWLKSRVIAYARARDKGLEGQLFTAGLIPSMSRSDMQRVYRLLKEAREEGMIPWEWIVDETREIERTSTWADPAAYARAVARSYRRDFWDQQPVRVMVVGEKGTVRGLLRPVLDDFAVGFQVMHGFSSATIVHEISEDDDGRDLIVLYVGDYDPSGLYMSQEDLPNRFAKYDGDHVTLKRIALTREQVRGLPSFPAADKKKDPRYKWFSSNHGDRCWELDAMDPNDLRACVERAIMELIEPVAWQRCEVVNGAEQESLTSILDAWIKQ